MKKICITFTALLFFIFTYSQGKIGIGTNNPNFKLHVIDTLPVFSGPSMRLNIESGNQLDSVYKGLDVILNGTSGSNRAIQGYSLGVNSQMNIGMIGFAHNATDNRGAYGYSGYENTNPNGFNYGLTGVARQSEYANIAIGGYAELGTNGSGDNFGVSARASSTTSGVNYGIYSEANNGTDNYAGFFNGDVTITGVLTNPSDIKLKSNVKQLVNVLPIIRKLQPVEYDYKRDLLGQSLNLPKSHQYGFIAQEIQTILPELVSGQKINLRTAGGTYNLGTDECGKNNDIHSENIQFMGVNYISIIPILVQAVKEQDAKINQLESMLLKLQQQLDDLKKSR